MDTQIDVGSVVQMEKRKFFMERYCQLICSILMSSEEWHYCRKCHKRGIRKCLGKVRENIKCKFYQKYFIYLLFLTDFFLMDLFLGKI